MLRMSTRLLSELVKVLRSKNAGPASLTLDLFFLNAEFYQIGLESASLSTHKIAEIYEVLPEAVKKFALPQINAIKFSLPRKLIAGTPGDSDLYGAQQHGYMLRLEV